jgi:methylenetetrahydrofolate--tRNA-(uracil-5-)-methyltransferase
MEGLDSLVIRAAKASAVPAGQALGVDREIFSTFVEAALDSFSTFRRRCVHFDSIPTQDELSASNSALIIASGPLTSDPLALELRRVIGGDLRLYFYDAIAPVIAADSIDFDHCFFANRYEDHSTDYLNIPLNKEQYEQFIDAIVAADKMPLHEFESTPYFESCLPIEVMVERGRETPRFGPMKPVGLTDPKTNRWPHAVIQLRRENLEGSIYSMVGFQTKMKYPAQESVFRSLPALKHAEFFRLGSVHRNTYIEGPKVLGEDLSLRVSPNIFLAGQITGVEGYTESAAMGLLAGRAASARLQSTSFRMPPKQTMIGALKHYVTDGCLGPFQPMNANLGLLPQIKRQKGVSKLEKKQQQCRAAHREFEAYMSQSSLSAVSQGRIDNRDEILSLQ